MSISITNSSRIAALGVGVALALTLAFGGFAAPAQALTQAEASAIITALGLTGSQAAVIQGLVTGSASGSCSFSRDLTIGATGADVTCLQQALIGAGFSIPAGATGYFGTQTRAAVGSWQASRNVAPAVGYFGPISRGAWNLGGTTGGGTTPPPTSGGALQGGAGSISDADYVSGLSSEEVGEDQEDVEVAGLVLEADDGSDIELTAVNLNFSPGAGVGSNDFDEYADEVSIWLDGEELARVDASDFQDDQLFNRTISLDSGGIIRSGDEGDLVVAVTAVSNIDSTDAGDTWNLEFESVRFRDAQGASITDSDTGDINDATGRNFTFDTFATANDVELKATACDDTPEGVVNVDSSSDTNGVDILCFTLEAEGGDIHLEDLPITLATSTGNTADTVAEMLNSVTVTVGGDEWSEDISAATIGAAGATITFDDFDYDLSDGDEVDVVVSADINDTQAGEFVDGDALTASFTASNRNVLTAEDESGEDLVAGDRTGTGLGEALAFYDVGIMVSLVSTDREVTSDADTANTDTGTFTIVFNVEAFDGTVYVADTSDVTTDATTNNATIDETLYRLLNGGVATAVGLSDAVSYSTDDGASDSTNGNIQLEDGESTDISLIVSRTNTAANPGGIMQLFLQAIAWSSTDLTGDSSTDQYSVFDFNLEDYKTSPMSLN